MNILKNDINELVMLLNKSKNSYSNFHSNGQTYKLAKKIREDNLAILCFIKSLENNQSIKAEILLLKAHIIDWLDAWNKHKLKGNYKEDDIFIFNDYKKFPHSVEKKLEIYKS